MVLISFEQHGVNSNAVTVEEDQPDEIDTCIVGTPILIDSLRCIVKDVYIQQEFVFHKLVLPEGVEVIR